VLARLRALANPDAVRGMARFGINADRTLGIGIPALRPLAREIGTDHALAAELWASGIHEARILASMIDDPALVQARRLKAFLPLIVAGSADERNFVKKAMNWALRQIGKRSPALHRAALRTSERLAARHAGAARWIGSDARRELVRVGEQRGWS
jgi:3-methyladenine DNA glycosylase AlkD